MLSDKRKRELKKILNPKRYANVAKLNASEWFYQLWHRYSIKSPIVEESVQGNIDILLENPIVPIDDLVDVGDGGFHELEWNVPSVGSRSSVFFISRAEAYRFQKIFEVNEEEKRLYLDANSKDKSLQELLCGERYKTYFKQPFDYFIQKDKKDVKHPYNPDLHGNFINLSVDMSSSDSKIIDDFKKVLAEAREKLGPYVGKKRKKDGLKKIKDAKFIEGNFTRSFFSSRVLQYIDLMIILNAAGEEATEEEVVDPSGSIVGDKLKPAEKYLMSLEFFNKLGAYLKNKNR